MKLVIIPFPIQNIKKMFFVKDTFMQLIKSQISAPLTVVLMVDAQKMATAAYANQAMEETGVPNVCYHAYLKTKFILLSCQNLRKDSVLLAFAT